MIEMRIDRSENKGFTMYFESVEDIKKFETFIKDLIEGVRRVLNVADWYGARGCCKTCHTGYDVQTGEFYEKEKLRGYRVYKRTGRCLCYDCKCRRCMWYDEEGKSCNY